MKRTLGFVAVLVLVQSAGTAGAVTAATPGWFAFPMRGGAPLQDPANVSFLNDADAGSPGRITVLDGHFANPAGKRVNFFGTNLTADACFPDPADGPRVARRLRSLGFNLVRLHFMDIRSPNGLMQEDLLTIQEAQRDRLERFIKALKDEGIRVNVNLHVARRYPGITDAVAERFGFGKVLDRFYPPFIAMQKAYARELLTHVNPYTGLALAADPVVLCVEMNNENTLLPFWGGGPDDLPEPFAAELKRQWNAWLKTTYGTTRALAAAWGTGAKAAGGELLTNGSFAGGTTGWTAEAAHGAKATLASAAGVLRWSCLASGAEDWNLQLHQTSLSLTGGIAYQLRFSARSATPMDLSVSTMLAVEPWSGLGLSRTVRLTPEWTDYDLLFTAGDSRGPRARLNFSTGNRTGIIDVRSVSLRAAPLTGLPAGERLETGTVSLRPAGGPPAVVRDHWAFLVATERATTAALRQFLKDDLKVQSLVYDTQAGYGGVAGVVREGEASDLVDDHGYWEHPSFPEKGWDPVHWTIRNISQIGAASGGTLAELAMRRVAGKPFTVSEYNLPAPNDHAAETLPMLAAFAAFQDWDAVYAYTYMDFKTEWDTDRLVGFFDFCGHPGKLAFAPLAALAFRNGLVAPGRTPVTLTIPGDPAGYLAAGKGNVQDLWNDAGTPPAAAAMRRLEVRLSRGASGAPTVSESVRPSGTRHADTGELAWAPESARPVFTVSAPAFRMVAGTMAGRTFHLGDLAVTVAPRSFDYACVAAVCLDGKPLAESTRVLVAVASRVENQSMGWNPERSSVGKDWGTGPAVAEAVEAAVILPGSGWTAVALDPAGRPMGRPGGSVPAGTPIRLQARTLWYLLSR